MKKLKDYALAFLSGTVVVLGWVVIFLLKNAKPVINTDSYVETVKQKIGKVKQKGRNNEQDVDQEETGLSRKEIRQQRKADRKAARKAKRKEKQK